VENRLASSAVEAREGALKPRQSCNASLSSVCVCLRAIATPSRGSRFGINDSRYHPLNPSERRPNTTSILKRTLTHGLITTLGIMGLTIGIANAAPGGSLTGNIVITSCRPQATNIIATGGVLGGARLSGIIRGADQKDDPKAEPVIQSLSVQIVPSTARITIVDNEVEKITNAGSRVTLQGVGVRLDAPRQREVSRGQCASSGKPGAEEAEVAPACRR
jgi:hypothetical protein